MSQSALRRHPKPGSIPRWEPPLAPDQLRCVLAKMARWQPIDLDVVYDDLEQVLGEFCPAPSAVGAIGDRLRDALAQLSNIACADPAFAPSPEIAALVEQGAGLRGEAKPRDDRQALGQVRRIALTTSDIVDRLIAERHIKNDDQT